MTTISTIKSGETLFSKNLVPVNWIFKLYGLDYGSLFISKGCKIHEQEDLALCVFLVWIPSVNLLHNVLGPAHPCPSQLLPFQVHAHSCHGHEVRLHYLICFLSSALTNSNHVYLSDTQRLLYDSFRLPTIRNDSLRLPPTPSDSVQLPRTPSDSFRPRHKEALVWTLHPLTLHRALKFPTSLQISWL